MRQPNQIASGNPKEGRSTKKPYTRDHSWVHLGGKWTTTLSSMKKTTGRKRKDISLAPPNPTDLQHMVIPTPYKVYKPDNVTEEKFLLADSGQGSNRIIIFGRESWIHLLVDSTWFVDGTFNIARILFSLLYCILAKRMMGFIQSCIYFYQISNVQLMCACLK